MSESCGVVPVVTATSYSESERHDGLGVLAGVEVGPAGSDAFVSHVERALRRHERHAGGDVVVMRVTMSSPRKDGLGGSAPGQGAYERLYAAAGRRLRSHYRLSDCVARSSEDFVVCAEDVLGEDGLRSVMTRPIAVLGAPFRVDGVTEPVVVSVGAVTSELCADAAKLVEMAGTALAEARQVVGESAVLVWPEARSDDDLACQEPASAELDLAELYRPAASGDPSGTAVRASDFHNHAADRTALGELGKRRDDGREGFAQEPGFSEVAMVEGISAGRAPAEAAAISGTSGTNVSVSTAAPVARGEARPARGGKGHDRVAHDPVAHDPVAHDPVALSRLTPAERVVLDGLCQGKSATSLAAELVVSLATVRSHIRAILMKLGVNSQLAAVAYANQLREGD
ncbi:MAG: LuxR C-terminal-related transcriptional regulator [Actinobacteria bacterium]|nr:LuxR C-terminal-related transcriptional regulator [Actinomycetota bacterium]